METKKFYLFGDIEYIEPFITIIKDKGFIEEEFIDMSDNDDLSLAVRPEEKDYYFYNTGYETKGLKQFQVPNQFGEALEHLNKSLEPPYKENDWVVINFNKIVKLNYLEYNNSGQKIWDVEGHFAGVFPDEIERKATPEEIFDHLRKQSNIKIGDLIIHGKTKFNVNKIILYSTHKKTGSIGSTVCENYYAKYGDHLCVGGESYLVPLNEVRKVKKQKKKPTKNERKSPRISKRKLTNAITFFENYVDEPILDIKIITSNMYEIRTYHNSYNVNIANNKIDKVYPDPE